MATVEMQDAPPQQPQPLTCDLGHLLCSDPNPLPSLKSASNTTEREAILADTARNCAQTLINSLLTNCPIARAPDSGDLQISLPTPQTLLPREKPVPKDKDKTKWERFAEKKGIQKKKKDGKMKFDEGKQQWVAKYGYKGKREEGDMADWLEEVDEKAEGKKGEESGKGRKAKKGR